MSELGAQDRDEYVKAEEILLNIRYFVARGLCRHTFTRHLFLANSGTRRLRLRKTDPASQGRKNVLMHLNGASARYGVDKQ